MDLVSHQEVQGLPITLFADDRDMTFLYKQFDVFTCEGSELFRKRKCLESHIVQEKCSIITNAAPS